MSALRFEFGANWSKFLSVLSDEGIATAEKSLRIMLGVDDLAGKTFLDIGSGSGLFSLAARRLGARVYSFDYDQNSVNCTRELKKRYFKDDDQWTIERGSILDDTYIKTLEKFDFVYSWGVLHHTGAMWTALDNVKGLVHLNGKLFIAIYNDQGRYSSVWLQIKRIYNKLPSFLRFIVFVPAIIRLWGPTFFRDLIGLNPFRSWRNYANHGVRGMNPWYDVIDWVGGLPFEVATPEEIFSFFLKSNFILEKMKTCGGGHGCNEFVFVKSADID